MLGKLIKYEFKASGRILLPVYAATLILAIITGIFSRVPATLQSNFGFLKITATLITMIYVMFVFASSIISTIISVYRFKTNLFGAEGYLMHTLPVKTHTHITSKLIVSVLYQIIGIIVAIVSGAVLLMFTDFYINLDLSVFIGDLMELMAENPIIPIAYAIEMVLLCFSFLACINMMLFSAISVGHSANTIKVAKSVGTYIAFHFASQIINFVVLQMIFSLGLDVYIDSVKNINAGHILITGLIICEILYTAVFVK